MNIRQRLIVGALWIGVGAVMVITIEPGIPSTASEILKLFVVLLALFIAGVYLLDPWNVISRQRFH